MSDVATRQGKAKRESYHQGLGRGTEKILPKNLQKDQGAVSPLISDFENCEEI